MGKLPKLRISSRKRSSSLLNRSRVRVAMASAPGMPAQDRSRLSAGERLADAARHRPRPDGSLAAERFDDLLAELPQADAVARQLRVGLHQAEDVALRRVGVHAEQQVGRAEVEEAERVRLHDLRQVQHRRRRAASAGWSPRGSASPALAEASRWLTGQMPQMRAMSDGISQNGRPSQNFSKPRNCGHVEMGVVDAGPARRGGSRSWRGPRCG